MGVPKFFRYISERYPCLSELVKEYQIPDFDNLYLDMNGIIHTCSHPDDFDPHFRISEEKIFQDIFQYIELLFRMIKPQKLFFMAIDGVAPRAKMNQQRGRRFRSAKEAEMLEEKAKRKGEVLPPESRFDSNCITPGTVFMVRLHEQLKYFVTYKISTDRLWQNCKVILSGHETPGEGEHKIMDYIRYMKSQPGYDPNTRHCLYGLDADLIMLGLCTHEPHFSLLREEVKFGKKAKRKSSADGTNFYLLHLSLMREYLELEFITVKEKLPFEFDLEKIIDDWVLMGFLVGNDFIPHLPNFHITNGALPLLYDAYIKTLPNLEGYINESGTLNLQRFEKFMEVLSAFDLNTFSETYADLKYFEEKTGRKFNENKARKKLEPWNADEKEKTDKPRNSELESLIQMTEEMLFDGEDSSDFEDYSSETENDDLMKSEFQQHKTDYYMNKLDYASVTPEVLRSQAEGYVRAIQWNLHYYYDGVCSWSWYYPHHYAPFISDIKGFSNLSFEYKLGNPFLPFEQLLAVLPAASKTLLPEPYQELMTLKESPIINYYPVDFDTDLNGKKQEWEAVVLIPFIDEKELLDAMKLVESRLTPDEVKRNSHGPMMVYEYTEAVLEPYKAPEYFQTVKVNHAKVTPITNEDIRVPKDKLIKGVCPGVKTDVYYPGFPTMKHLKYSGQLRKEKVKVFDQPSRGENMILTVEHAQCDVKTVAKQLLGKSIYVNWPHLTEAKVMTVSDSQHRYHYTNSESIPYVVEENKGSLAGMWMSSKKFVLEHYMTRLGIDLGDPDILVHVLTMIGRKYIYGMAGKMTLEKQWADIPSTYAYHAVVSDISVYDPTFIVYKSVTDIFTIDSACFLLGYPYYGAQGKVIDTSQAVRNGRIKLSVNVTEEPNLTEVITLEKELAVQFMPGPVAAQRLAISPFLLSRITGTIFIISGPKVSPVPESANKTNIGLNLKFNKRNEEVPGYTKKNGTSWLYSLKAVQLINDYMNFCPQLFDYLSRNTNNDMFFESEVFTTENEDEPLKRIATWIKEQPFNSIEHQTCGSKVLDPQTISTLEKTIETYLESVKNNTKTAVIQVKPQNVLKPELHQSNLPPDPNVKFNLFDRIVNIRESHVVPVGLKGTIIAIHQPKDMNSVKMNYKADIMFDVVFDEPFVGGLALNCSSGKGYRISSSALINISYGVRSTNEKSNNTVEPAAPQMNTSWGKPKGPQVDPKDLWQQFKSPNENPQYVSPQLQNKTFMPQFQPQQILQNSKRYFPNSTEKNFTTVPEQLIMKPFPIQGPSQQNSQGFVNLQPNARPCSFQNYNKPNEIIKTVPNTAQVQRKVDTSVDVSTNVLKNLLKISTDNDQKGPENVAINPIVPPELLPQNTSVQNFFKQTNLKPSEPACVKLLSLYQRNGMGIPRYNYINGPNGTIQAQIFFPNRKCFTSNFSTSREMASESVAMLALLELEKESDQFNRQVQYIPPPPQQWYQRNIPQSAPMQNKQPFNKPRVPMQIPFETKPASSQEAFVPLQAIKQKQQQQSRTNVSENKKQSPEKRVTETQNVNQESNASSSSNAIQFGNGKDSKQSNKSKQIIQKKRKCRIAANFNVNQQK